MTSNLSGTVVFRGISILINFLIVDCPNRGTCYRARVPVVGIFRVWLDLSARFYSTPLPVGLLGGASRTHWAASARLALQGRELAAWIGLVPRQDSTGGKQKLGGISKQGDRYLRRLLIVSATAVIRHARAHLLHCTEVS
jgi:hypothetical protein